MIYGSKEFIRAHQDVTKRRYNHSYDRYTREAICSSCGTVIGEQDSYTDWSKGHFSFQDEKDNWKFCPYCGHKFKEEKTYATDEELIGTLGQLLDEHEDGIEMSEKVRQGIDEVYSALVARENNW